MEEEFSILDDIFDKVYEVLSNNIKIEKVIAETSISIKEVLNAIFYIGKGYKKEEQEVIKKLLTLGGYISREGYRRPFHINFFIHLPKDIIQGVTFLSPFIIEPHGLKYFWIEERYDTEDEAITKEEKKIIEEILNIMKKFGMSFLHVNANAIKWFTIVKRDVKKITGMDFAILISTSVLNEAPMRYSLIVKGSEEYVLDTVTLSYVYSHPPSEKETIEPILTLSCNKELFLKVFEYTLTRFEEWRKYISKLSLSYEERRLGDEIYTIITKQLRELHDLTALLPFFQEILEMKE